MRRTLRRGAAWLWASPNTALGLCMGLVALLAGGRATVTQGVVEFSAGRLARPVLALPPPLRFGAITFGHVVLALDAATLEATRIHEQAHVAQYERWGPLFLPAYAASSLWQLARGRGSYRDNAFERQARRAEALARRARRGSAQPGASTPSTKRSGIFR